MAFFGGARSPDIKMASMLPKAKKALISFISAGLCMVMQGYKTIMLHIFSYAEL
jgi:hypothetical protein